MKVSLLTKAYSTLDKVPSKLRKALSNKGISNSTAERRILISMKAMSIISLALTVGFLGWFWLFFESNGRISISEFAPVIVVYALYHLAFAIVGVATRSRPREPKQHWYP